MRQVGSAKSGVMGLAWLALLFTTLHSFVVAVVVVKSLLSSNTLCTFDKNCCVMPLSFLIWQPLGDNSCLIFGGTMATVAIQRKYQKLKAIQAIRNEFRCQWLYITTIQNGSRHLTKSA